MRRRHGDPGKGVRDACVGCRSLDRERFSREQERTAFSQMRGAFELLIGCVEKGGQLLRDGRRGCGSGDNDIVEADQGRRSG